MLVIWIYVIWYCSWNGLGILKIGTVYLVGMEILGGCDSTNTIGADFLESTKNCYYLVGAIILMNEKILLVNSFQYRSS